MPDELLPTLITPSAQETLNRFWNFFERTVINSRNGAFFLSTVHVIDNQLVARASVGVQEGESTDWHEEHWIVVDSDGQWRPYTAPIAQG